MFYRNFLLALVVMFGLNSAALAITAIEYCELHEESGAPGECVDDQPCVRLISNFGTEDCKKCAPGGCELIDCSECDGTPEE